MTYTIGLYVRTPESISEIFNANVGQTVRVASQALYNGVPTANLRVRFARFKPDGVTMGWIGEAYTRGDGWADVDYRIASDDVGVITFQSAIYVGEQMVASAPPKSLGVTAAPAVAPPAAPAVAVPYEYVWDWEGYTPNSYDTTARSVAGMPADPFDFANVTQTAKYTAITAATDAFIKKFAEQGTTATILSITPDVNVKTTVEYREYRDYTLATYHHWLSVKAKVVFTTDRSLGASPIDPATVALLTKIAEFIIVALIAAFAIMALKEWLQSMTTQSSTITTSITNPSDKPVTIQTPQGTVTIPAGGTYTYTESGTEPSLLGISGLGAIALIGLGLVLVLGLRRKEGE